MNKKQRIVVVLGLLLLAGLTLYPPMGRAITYGRTDFSGYRFIWEDGQIDLHRLLLSYLGGAAVVGIAYLLLGNKLEG
jgi:hypothetical protein